LELVEDFVFSLCEGVDARATETKVELYRRENMGDIARRQQRNHDEDRRVREIAGVSGTNGNTNGFQNKDDDDDKWKPRRMSNPLESDLDETPGPGGVGNKAGGGFGGLFGYTPQDPVGANPGFETGASAQVMAVPIDAAPVPMSAGKMMEPGNGMHVHHGGWDDEMLADPVRRAKREVDIANACGVDLTKLGRARAAGEALASVFC
jgi:hypothetical protein|tara:strand:- start:3468 stop:4088 length:621 start_codon:yes stop_codon:yes gene_type:complete